MIIIVILPITMLMVLEVTPPRCLLLQLSPQLGIIRTTPLGKFGRSERLSDSGRKLAREERINFEVVIAYGRKFSVIASELTISALIS